MSCPNCGLSTANFNCNNHLMQAPGGLLISHARGYQRNDKNVTFLFEEIARLNVLLHEKDKLITITTPDFNFVKQCYEPIEEEAT